MVVAVAVAETCFSTFSTLMQDTCVYMRLHCAKQNCGSLFFHSCVFVCVFWFDLQYDISSLVLQCICAYRWKVKSNPKEAKDKYCVTNDLVYRCVGYMPLNHWHDHVHCKHLVSLVLLHALV